MDLERYNKLSDKEKKDYQSFRTCDYRVVRDTNQVGLEVQ